MSHSIAPTIQLASGAKMPVLGLGTWQLTGGQAVGGVQHALDLGYRLIDTAVDYENQGQIGEALRDNPVGRDDVFLVSKVEEDEDTYAATGERLEQLGVERLDLCLIHRPPGVFDFELSETEMEALGQLNEHYASLAGLQYI
jgi:diketogulonate reductase-like aldo/keto reductase